MWLAVQLMGDDPSILDEETNRDIQKMRSVYHNAHCSAAVLLSSIACSCYCC